MSIKNQVAINVFNYNEFVVCSTTQVQGYRFAPAVDGIPSMQSMSFTEIQHINGKSDAFRSGLLRFEKEQEKEIYEALGIFNWENIITNEFIEDSILNPTIDKLQVLIDVTSPTVWLRVRTIFIRLQNSSDVDISHRVINLLNTRHSEIQNKIFKSEILLKPIEKSEPVTSNEVEDLKNQLIEMQRMMAQLLSNKNTDIPVKNDIDEIKENKKSETKSTSKKNK